MVDITAFPPSLVRLRFHYLYPRFFRKDHEKWSNSKDLKGIRDAHQLLDWDRMQPRNDDTSSQWSLVRRLGGKTLLFFIGADKKHGTSHHVRNLFVKHQTHEQPE